MSDIGLMILGSENDGRMKATFTWFNVSIAALFIFVNVVISMCMRLKLEIPLISSSLRCIVQLTIMGLILQDVFSAHNPYYVALLTMILILLSTYETCYNKADKMWSGMFMSVLVNTAFSTLLVGIIGTRWAMREKSFWVPEIFIPTIGLLLGITASSMAVALNQCLEELSSNQGRIETYLSLGATRYEAARSIAIDAVRVAMLPTINRMSIVGLITIPGTMTGQILSGAPIWNAVRYQEIISFMITASSGIAVLGVVVMCMHVIVDARHRLRSEWIKDVKTPVFHSIKKWIKKRYRQILSSDERQPLLSS